MRGECAPHTFTPGTGETTGTGAEVGIDGIRAGATVQTWQTGTLINICLKIRGSVEETR